MELRNSMETEMPDQKDLVDHIACKHTPPTSAYYPLVNHTMQFSVLARGNIRRPIRSLKKFGALLLQVT